jgi:hypothetical protein
MVGICYGFAAQNNANMTGTWQDIYAFVWVPRVSKDLLEECVNL